MENKDYDDIIMLPHPVSKKHMPMSIYNRAAQFAPFAALTGYEDAVHETARRTDSKIILDEDAKDILDKKMLWIQEHIEEKPEVQLTYFVADEKKEGGTYMTLKGHIAKIKSYEQSVLLQEGEQIAIADITDIQGEIFDLLVSQEIP